MSGWVSIHRQIEKWEWYKKENYAHLFQHLLRKANHIEKKWQGTTISRGQFITSPGHLSKETGIKYQTVRTIIKNLKKSGEIVTKSTNKNTMITICNYDSYQSDEGRTNKQLTINQQTTNKQLTTTNNGKKEKKENKAAVRWSTEENKFSSLTQHTENKSVGKTNSITEAKRKNRMNKNSTFFDIPTEPELELPKSIILTESQVAIMNKRKEQNKNTYKSPVLRNPNNYLIDLTDKISGVIGLTFLIKGKKFYKPTPEFNWYNAAKILNETIKKDERYAEFKISIPIKTDNAEINLLYHIIKIGNKYESMLNYIVETGGIYFDDKLIYSMVFKTAVYASSMDWLLKIHKNNEHNDYTKVEKMITDEELKKSDYTNQTGEK